jgi:DNA-directed RNA polymerase subunit RPC12/RpoP
MSYQCPICGEEYDIALFQFGKKIACPCGEVIDASRPRVIKPEIRMDDKAEDDKS